MNQFAAIGFAALFGVESMAAMPLGLAPNRATYDLRLEHTSPGGAVAARGRLVIQFRDTCDGWSTAQRMVADLTDSDGAVRRSDFLIMAWESKDGRSMRFDVKSAYGGKLHKEKRGTATVDDTGQVTVTLLSPDRRQFTLPRGAEFPSQQIREIVHAAEQGQGMVKRLVFQGGDESDFYISTAVIGHTVQAAATQTERAVDKAGLLKNVAVWSTLVSYFANKRSADLPDYEVASRLYANGISGTMSLIYSRYALRATLARLEPLLPSCSTGESSLSQGADVDSHKGR